MNYDVVCCTIMLCDAVELRVILTIRNINHALHMFVITSKVQLRCYAVKYKTHYHV